MNRSGVFLCQHSPIDFTYSVIVSKSVPFSTKRRINNHYKSFAILYSICMISENPVRSKTSVTLSFTFLTVIPSFSFIPL